MNKSMEGLIDFMKAHITEERWALMQNVVNNRSRHVAVVVEDIYQAHNASAVLRTSDCFGFQDVHIIENKNSYEINPHVELGSSKWLDIHTYNQEEDNSPSCMDDLEARGYALVATSPHVNAHTPETLPLDRPVAILLGNEKDGLRKKTMARCQYHLKIPMYGFTESFNISVSAAIILSHLRERLENGDLDFTVSEEEKQVILLTWLKRCMKNPDLIEARYHEGVK